MDEYHVLGPPGTGKTTYLTKQVAVAVERVGIEGVLVVSFTKAAAKEIEARIAPQMPPGDEEWKNRGGYTFDPDRPSEGQIRPQKRHSNIGTLHSICHRLLDRPKVAETLLDEWNATVSRDMQLAGGTDDLQGGDAMYSKLQKLRARMVTNRSLWPPAVRRWAAKWDAWKADVGCLDYTDLVEQAIDQDIRLESKIGIIDEAQDFTKLELELVRRWSSDQETTVYAYDDDQALYVFKGATPEALIERLPSSDHVRVLSQSYRVPRAVHAVTEKWVRKIKTRVEKVYMPRDAEGSVVRMDDVHAYHVHRMVKAIREDVSSDRTVMVLASCAYHLSATTKALKDAGLCFHNPYRPANGAWNPLRTKKGATTHRLASYLARNELYATSPGHARLHVWTAEEMYMIVQNLSAKVLKQGTKTKLKELLDTDGFKDELVDESDWVLPEHLCWFEAGDMNEYLKNLMDSKRKSFEYASRILTAGGLDALVEKPQVIVGTIHSVKGGEADSVYLFPDISSEGGRQWAGQQRDEIYRMFYVGMTRAREKLTLLGRRNYLAVEW